MKTKLSALFLLIALLSSFCLISCDIDLAPAPSTTTEPTTSAETTAQATTAINLPSFEDGQAYVLEYTSNGDGTCYVTGILVNPNYSNPEYKNPWVDADNDFELVIPEKSPDGDTVTGISWGSAFDSVTSYFPAGMITKESFENILEEFEANGISPDDFIYRKFNSFFLYFDASSAPSEKAKDEMIKKYPITKYLPVYVLDPVVAHHIICFVVNTIRENSSYEIDTPNIERERFINLLTEKGVENAESWFPSDTVPDCLNMGVYISSVSLPRTIETIDAKAFNNTSIREIVLPASVKSIARDAFNSDHITIYSLSEDENDPVYSQTFDFDCTVLQHSGTEPDTAVAHKYWRYVDGKPERWAEEPEN